MKKLYRSRKNKVLGGVCGGLGDYFDIDPVLIRIIFAVALIFHGFGVLAYIIMWIIVPEEPFIFPGTSGESDSFNENIKPETDPQSFTPTQSNDTGRMVAGIFLIAFGLLFLSHKYLMFFHITDILPFALVVLGVLLIINSFKR